MNTYGYVGGNPLYYVDQFGLVNKVKVVVGLTNGAKSIYQGVQSGGLAVASLFAFAIGQPEIGIPAAALAAIRFRNATKSEKRAGNQIGEGFAEILAANHVKI